MDDSTTIEIFNLKKHHSVSLFDAFLIYCENNDIEPDELLSKDDINIIDVLRNDAVVENSYLKKFIKHDRVIKF